MPLPVLPAHAMTSDADLLRGFQRSEKLWAEQLGEAEQLDVGVAITSTELPDAWPANRVVEAALPSGMPAEEAVAQVEQFYASKGLQCRGWQLNPSVDAAHHTPLVEYLSNAGYQLQSAEVMALTTPARLAHQSLPGVTILPARAAFRHARQLAEEVAGDSQTSLVEAQLLHLDDPRCDGLLALRGGAAVGRTTVFAVGEMGRIDQVHVAAAARRQGIGSLLIDRALEICARSLFKHVLLSVEKENEPAIAFYRKLGFRKIGQMQSYLR